MNAEKVFNSGSHDPDLFEMLFKGPKGLHEKVQQVKDMAKVLEYNVSYRYWEKDIILYDGERRDSAYISFYNPNINASHGLTIGFAADDDFNIVWSGFFSFGKLYCDSNRHGLFFPIIQLASSL